jgi:tryptophan 7-halogenase
VAYHIENKTFVAFLEGYALGLGVVVRDDTVAEVFQDESGITGLRLASGGEAVTADLYLDCSGFASVLLGRTLQEPFISFKPSLFNDRAVVGGWQRTDEPIKPYTTAETMDAGWCWQIEHEHRIERGYVHSSSFISDDAAETEFRGKNPKVESTRIVKLISGRYERGWVKNVIAIGNASGFVEPLESTSLAAICRQTTAVAETLHDCDRQPRPSLVKQFNYKNGWGWDRIRQFLAVHYKFNTRLDTPYWRECREHADLVGAADIVEYYQENGPSVLWRSILLKQEDQFNMEGYLSLLVGQQVPYRRTYTPDEQDLRSWQQIKQSIRTKATQAFSVPEALRLIRSPHWTWPNDLYYVPLGTAGVSRGR